MYQRHLAIAVVGAILVTGGDYPLRIRVLSASRSCASWKHRQRIPDHGPRAEMFKTPGKMLSPAGRSLMLCGFSQFCYVVASHFLSSLTG
jgi:hypothetical protein